MNVLFVTNGHGEIAIAKKIAEEVRTLAPLGTDHFALVGAEMGDASFRDVGPQRAMPSGGLVAMGNVRAFARDLRAGFAGLFVAQRRFLRSIRGAYAVVVAVGDAYGCALALHARTPTVFVGTAKSVRVTPYGPLERRILRRAVRVFVRDEPTAAALRAHGVDAAAPGNVIVDLLAHEDRYPWSGTHRIAVLPGSRPRAYDDASILARLVRRVAARTGRVEAALSIAPGLDPDRFAPALDPAVPIVPWRGSVGALLDGATLALGQAGTANEAAAAFGVPVVALERDGDRRTAWYRMRQARLLGDALLILDDGDPERAAETIAALLHDPARRAAMSAAGRERMGPPGGARAIAASIAALAEAAA